MPLLLVILFALPLSGCFADRAPLAQEPDTEWILAQYHGQDETVVDARRVHEGW